MIVYIALTLSIINSILWVVFVIGVRHLFIKILPMLAMMGFTPTQNLKYSKVSDRIEEPLKLADGKSDK